MGVVGSVGLLGPECRPRASLDTKVRDSRGPRERASMKEYSLSLSVSTVR